MPTARKVVILLTFGQRPVREIFLGVFRWGVIFEQAMLISLVCHGRNALKLLIIRCQHTIECQNKYAE